MKAINNYEIEQQWGISPELWQWCHEANKHLDEYFLREAHRYGKKRTLKEIMHDEAQERMQEKNARTRSM